ncbi:S1 RNA-binding domain-containing protein, partial [bacterium]
SQISRERIKNIEDVIHIGDKVKVKILKYDDCYENLVASKKQAL